MNEILEFSDFLKKTHYRLTGKGKIARNTLDETRLTDNYITTVSYTHLVFFVLFCFYKLF